MLEKFLKLTPNRDRSTFLNLQRTWSQVFGISQCQKLPQEGRLRLGSHFFPNWNHKNSNSMMMKRVSVNFPQSEISYESKGLLFDQMKVSTINKKPRQFHMIKSNKEVTLKTRGTYFIYRKPQSWKLRKKVFRNLFAKKLLKIFSSR